MPNAKLVATGKPKVGGAIYRAPLGTPLPTSVNEELDKAFKDMGYVSEDGVTSSNTRESESIKAWGGATVATPQTNYEDLWKAVFIESKNIDVLKMVYGDANVSGDIKNGIVIKANAQELEYASYVFDMILNGARKRTVLPNASISEVGDTVYVDNDVVGYDTTLAALPDEDENTHYEYIMEDESLTQYTVTFDSDGGSAVASKRVPGGGTVTRPTDPTKDRYAFNGWTLNGAAYDFDTPVKSNITLVASWTQTTFIVTFDSNGGSDVPAQEIQTGNTATEPAEPTKGTDTFDGWYSDAELTQAYVFSTPVTADITLYAKWTTA